MSITAHSPEAKVDRFVHWMQENGVQMRASKIWTSDEKVRGLGLFSSSDDNTGVLMVSPLYLAITPMSVLQHQELGSSYGRLFEDGEVDDRLLMILFLMIERIRGSTSFWAPYLNVLPTTFRTPLWFTEKEMEELKGTSLYNATRIQLKNLKSHFTDKVKPFAEKLLSSIGALEREIDFEDFLWANCIFWTRALNIPCPHSFVFPNQVAEKDCTIVENGGSPRETQMGKSKEIVWVEGLVPGIDFCNHEPKAVTHWEVDGEEGLKTGVPYSMYLITDGHLSDNDEILISYGNKGNEELLFLYGFVIDMNPDDYFMVHFPKEALDQDPCNEAKIQLLQEQDLTLRWLLPGSLLQKGFFIEEGINSVGEIAHNGEASSNSFSWSGNRKPPSFLNQFVFPEDAMAALRVVSMKDDELKRVVSMLEELSQSGQQTTPSSDDIRAAVWEVCGNVTALQLLVDLISARLLDLEEGTGTEDIDKEILTRDNQEQDCNKLTENVRNCIVYRRWQKYFAKRFLREAERLLELSILEDQS